MVCLYSNLLIISLYARWALQLVNTATLTKAG
jgi:hypothetical protein